jgi:ubiquinone/menaquinone biosynthesis C-methylase UbiE
MTKLIPAARFHFLTPLFDFLCSLVGLGKKYRYHLRQSIQLNDSELQVLDAGCGSGSLSIEIKQAYPKITLHAIDADSSILKLAKRKFAKANAEIHLQQAYLQKLPFPDNSFDVVYSSLVIHHLKTKEKIAAFAEISRILKPSGYFFLADFSKPSSIFFAPFSWFTVFFEEGLDNYRGKIPTMLKSRFHVQKISKYRFNITFWKAVKF